ncbi:MAG: CpsB/CapC family capsule biosynthesis tyrosine phosphatase [Bacteroidota bacterium]|nr:CpsB/CapC family capsule biosynthesis tyrosine phosphatase [Bacteroidota bacterium]
MGLFSFFQNKEKELSKRIDLGYQTEFHNHLLPNIDDGVESVEESIQIINILHGLGINRIITTPHIMSDFYKNTPQNIGDKLELVQKSIQDQNISVVLEAAAEYYLDEGFIEMLNKNKPFLFFGDGYVLFETSYMNESPFLTKVIFDLKNAGYKPILAHPERYTYFRGNMKMYESVYEKGIYFQLNMNSLTGYYAPEVKKIAEKLIDAEMVDFIGTDCHGMKHVPIITKAITMPYYEKLLQLNILNDKIPLTSHRK